MWKIDVGVGGRFHADRAVTHFLAQGWDARLHSTLPEARFANLPQGAIRTFIPPEIVFRALMKVGWGDFGDEIKMRWFGSWMARQLREQTDLFIGWSSFSVETFRLKRCRNLVVRDSAHIDLQNEILRSEFGQFSIKYPERNICREREVEEYELADGILVLSEFARKSFIDKGISPSKLHLVRLGCDLGKFRASASPPRNQKLQVVYFGNLSLQKGVHYLLDAFAKIDPSHAELTLIGAVLPEFRNTLRRYSQFKWLGPKPHDELAKLLPSFDVFVFPTLHDGFGQTLLQAMACGVVPIVTTNCGASDVIRPNENGFVVPIRSAEAIRSRIIELLDRRDLVATMRRAAVQTSSSYTWSHYNSQLTEVVKKILERGPA